MTFNTPRYIEPDKIPTDDSRESVRPTDRPSPEKVSPSQHGRFLSAMERKENKETSKGATGDAETQETEEGSEKTIFQFSSLKGLKQEGETGDALESGGKGHVPSKEEIEVLGEEELDLSGETPITKGLPGKPKGVVPTTQGTKSIKKGTSVSGLPTKETELLASEAVGGQEAAKASLRAAKGGTTPEPERQQGRILQGEQAPKRHSHLEVGLEKPTQPATTTWFSRPKTGSTPAEPQGKPVAQPVFGYTQVGSVETPKTPTTAETRTAILEIIQQTVQAIEVLKTKNETTITVTIQHPPLFAGATVRIVESTTARNEFNITFDNLSPEARRLIETQSNQVHLQQSLLDRGYTLRNIVIAPEVRFTPAAQIGQAAAPGEQRTRDEGQGSEGFDQGESSGKRTR